MSRQKSTRITIVGGVVLMGTVAVGVIGHNIGKNLFPSRPPIEQAPATYIDETKQYQGLLDSFCSDCSSIASYRDCLNGLLEDAYKRGSSSVVCPTTQADYNALAAERDDCNKNLLNSEKRYKHFVSNSDQTVCQQNLEKALDLEDQCNTSVRECQKKSEDCESVKKVAETDRDKFKYAIVTMYTPQKKTINATAFVLALDAIKTNKNTEFCRYMSKWYMPIKDVLDQFNIPLVGVEIGDLDGMGLIGYYNIHCPVTIPTTTP